MTTGVAILAASPSAAQDEQAPSAADTPIPGPVTAERLAAAHRLLATRRMGPRMMAFIPAMRSQLESQFHPRLAALSQHDQAQAMAAFDRTFDSMTQAHEQIVLDEMANNYASRLDVRDMQEAIDFYSSDLGRRLTDDPKNVTPEDRLKTGHLIRTHPGLFKLVNIDLEYGRAQLANAQNNQVRFQADFQAQLCRNLATAHVKLSDCPAGAVRPGA